MIVEVCVDHRGILLDTTQTSVALNPKPKALFVEGIQVFFLCFKALGCCGLECRTLG